MILSDHGYNIEDDDSSEKRQHPILFVKGVGELMMNYRFPLLPFPNLIIWKPTHDFWMANRGMLSLITRKVMPENDVSCSMITMSPLIFMSICRPDMPEM